jgi:hypothetical protein
MNRFILNLISMTCEKESAQEVKHLPTPRQLPLTTHRFV